MYFATVHARLRCPVALLVLCPSPATAAWCAEPIRIGDPGMVLTPVVVGPHQVPVLTDVDQARKTPELAVLSALAHGSRDDPDPVLSTLVSVLDLFDLDHAKLYTDLVVMALLTASRTRMKEIMTAAAREHTSAFASAYLPQTFARGKAEGTAEGRATALLTVLDARGIKVPDDARARISSCTDIEQLDSWIRSAVTVSTVDDLFE